MEKFQRLSLIIHKQLMKYMKTQDYNPTKSKKMLIVFDNMRADVEANKRWGPIATELFNRKNLIIRIRRGGTYYKTTFSDKIKTIDNKLKRSKAQYSLDRQTAKISVSSLENVSKYELSMGEYVLPE